MKRLHRDRINNNIYSHKHTRLLYDTRVWFIGMATHVRKCGLITNALVGSDLVSRVDSTIYKSLFYIDTYHRARDHFALVFRGLVLNPISYTPPPSGI